MHCPLVGKQAVDDEDDGMSSPLSYDNMLARNPTVQQNHLVKLLEQLLVHNRASVESLELPNSRIPSGADVPTLLGTRSFSLFDSERKKSSKVVPEWIRQSRWPHWHADQVHGLIFRELGGGYARHKQAPSVRTPSYVIVKPAVLVDRIQIIKKLRGHRNAMYCAIFDGTGRYVITGSDDRLVKLWSAETGLCLRSCRGHEGDITDLAVSNRNKYVASASNDFVIRVWSLPSGYPVSVLRGHTASVTATAFSPRQGCEHLLLSSSDDGTCRIWDATDSTRHSRVYMPNPKDMNPAPKPAAPAAPATVPGCNQILCCAFNADGSIFVTGSSDKIARVWDACKWNDDVTGRPNYEMDTLKGHENDVNYVQFSGCAAPRKPLLGDSIKEEHATRFRNSWFSHDSIVTCSRDGTAIIWMPHISKSYVKVGRWQKAYHLRVPPPPMPPQPPRGNGPRQRLLPTPRGVNMIVWSLDNRFVLAAIMDHRICVWNASDGSLVHSLTGHDKQTYVLDVHPINPRIAMSAGYDGRVIIWDIWEGRPIKVYETGEYNLVDGNFSPDGTSLVVSDEVGQIYIFGTGSKMSEKDVKYDQFFLGDFRPLQRDLHGNVLDVETQLPPHLRNLRDLLCDAGMIPYCDPYQTIYQQRRLAHLGLEWQPPTMMLSIGTNDDVTYFPPEQPAAFQPPVALSPERHDGPGPANVDRNRWVEQPPEVEEAMDWEQDAAVHSEDTGSDYSASEESLSDEKEGDGYESLSEGESNSEEEEELEAPMHLRRSGRNKRKKLESGRSSSRRRVRGRTSTDYDTRKRRQQRGRHSKASRNGSNRASRVTVVSDQDHVSTRPQRQAARNALNLFSSIQTPGRDEDEEDSADREETVAAETVNTGQEERGPSSMTGGELRAQLRSLRRNSREEGEEENEQRNQRTHASTSQPEVDNLGDCRRPRSQRPRRIKIIFNRPAGPLHNSLQSDGLGEGEGRAVHPSEPPSHSDDKLLSLSPAPEGMQPLEQSQKSHRKLIIKPPKPVSQESGSTSGMLERCSDEEGDVPREEGMLLSASNQESPILSPQVAQSISEEIVVEKQWQWKKGKAIKGAQTSGSSKYAEAGKDSESLESFERAILSNDRVQAHTWEQPQLPDNSRSAEDTCRPEDGSHFSEREREHDANVSSEHGGNEDNLVSVHELTDTLSQKVDLNKDPDQDEQQSRGAEWKERCEHNGNHSLMEVGSSDRSPISSGAGDLRTSRLQSTSKYEMEDKDQSQGSPASSREVGGCANDVDEGQEVLRPTQDSEQRLMETDFTDQETRGEYSDEDSNASRKNARDSQRANNTCVRLEEHHSQLRTAGEVTSSDEEADIRRDRESDYNEDAVGYETGQDQLEENAEKQASESEMDQDGYADEEESESQAYGTPASPNIRSRRQYKNDNIAVGSRSAERKRHKPLSELSSGQGHSLHSDGAESPAKRPTRHVRTAVEKNERRRQPWLREHNVDEELAGPSRSVSHTEPQVRGKNKRQKNNKLHDMPWESGTPSNGVVHGRQGLRSDASPSGTKSERSLRIKLKCVENTTKREAELPEDNDYRRGKQTRLSVRSAQRKNHAQKEKTKVVEVKVGVSNSIPRGGWRAPKQGLRKIESAAWLLMSEIEQGHYTPQYGDEVGYLQQGHREYLEASKVKEKGPWKQYDLRSVEFCRITNLDYHIEPGGGTSSKLELEFIDMESPACGCKFQLTWPELTDYPDFLVEKSRFDAAMAKGWVARDHCKVWWASEKGADDKGQWWDGRIKTIKAKSDDFPDSPWEKYIVTYRESAEPQAHSPWELFDRNCSIPGWVVPQIEEDERDELLQAIYDIEEGLSDDEEDEFGVKQLNTLASSEPNYLNRVPVPLTLDLIRERLVKNFYRSKVAVEYDIRLLVSNAELFFGDDSELTSKMNRLASDLSQLLQ